MSQHPFALYNPALLPPEVLLAEFTARRPMLERLLGVVRGNAAGHPPQHALIIGPRGSGKTMMLWAVAHRVRLDPQLAARWQPVVFDEESRRVGDLADLWLEAIRQWEHVTGSKEDRAGRLLVEAAPDIEDRARRTFLDLVDRSGKRALLLIDNLNDLLGSIHDPEPLHRLRAFLMKEPRVMLLGAATRYFDEVTQVDRPFYDFFRYFELQPLSLEEMKECVQALARSHGDCEIARTLEARGGTVQALHLLTGGNPRLVKTFYRLLREGLRGDIRSHLETLLDESTPHFKAIVDALPGQQQRLFDAVALAWDPVEVASIATTTRLPSNQVSSQLRLLVKSGLLNEIPRSPKKRSYLLADRFSNIHYLMRHGRAARNRFDWFVALVRLVFPDREATEVLARTAQDAAEGGPEGELDARAVLQSALVRAESAASRKALLHATIRQGWDRETRESLQQWFDNEETRAHLPEVEIVAFCHQMPSALRKELGYKPESAAWWYALTDFLEEKEAFALAESAYRKAIELNPRTAVYWLDLALLLDVKLKHIGEATRAYKRAIKLEPTNTLAWSCLATALVSMGGRPKEAERACRKAIELDPRDSGAWFSLGYLLEWLLHRPDESEAAYRKSVEIAPGNVDFVAYLGHFIYRHRGVTDEARRCATAALRLDPRSAFVRRAFESVAGQHAEDWREVLPVLANWCVVHPDNQAVFDFTVNGLLRLATLAAPADALAVLDALPDATPFETVRDALIAQGDREHLHALAPERRSVAIELLNRLSSLSAPAASGKTRSAGTARTARPAGGRAGLKTKSRTGRPQERSVQRSRKNISPM